MVGADLDVPRSAAIPSVFEGLPMTAVLLTPWHECGTLVDIRRESGFFVPRPTHGVRYRNADRSGGRGLHIWLAGRHRAPVEDPSGW